jgi:SAM-dependent methyltransferase
MDVEREAAGREYWDAYFSELAESDADLDWKGRWTAQFLASLQAAGARTVLELGCGTGNDAGRLARAGYEVTALDLSPEAIGRAQERFGSLARFQVGDVSRPLSFGDASFDAVMANVSLHMFPDAATRSLFAEIERVLVPGGLFLFHVNSTEDRPLRALRRSVARELEPDYVLEETGQTMHFFSEDYVRELLEGWRLDLEAVEIADRETGEPFKHVWRGIARRPG